MSGSFSSSSGGGGSGPRSHDISSQSGLTNLYNERITNIERVERPMNNIPHQLAQHQGVRVTTESGNQWLIHKGSDFGGSGGNTVVTDARHMSNNWQASNSSAVTNGTKIGDLVKKGGTDYNWAADNCYDAATRMEKKAGSK